MKFWIKLVVLVVIIALLAFAAVKLVDSLLNILDGVQEIGNLDDSETQFSEEFELETPKVVELTDQDYDRVQGIKEY